MSISAWSRLGTVLFSGALLFACATNASEPYTDDGTQNATATPAADKDASPPSDPYPSYDSGAAKDSGGTTTQDSGTTTQDAGTSDPDSGNTNPGPQDAGNPQPQDSGQGTVTTACDLSNPIQVAIYQYELSQQSSPRNCPCNTGECCYLLVCVKQ